MKYYLPFILILAAVFLSAPLSEAADQWGGTPKVTASNPANGAANVDPALTKITVTFNRPMMDKSWSWSYEDKDSFPQVAGQPFYIDAGTTCVLPVRLEPGKHYIIWINTGKFNNFKDKTGVSAEPYRIEFRTRQ